MTFPTALAAPVEDGIMLLPTARPPRQSLLEGPSTVFCVAVVEWIVLINPSIMPNLSLITFARGAKQLVVHDAFEIWQRRETRIYAFRGILTTVYLESYASRLTPQTNIGASADGAEMMTFLAPPFKWPDALRRTFKCIPWTGSNYSLVNRGENSR
jgi:hypothetical protein